LQSRCRQRFVALREDVAVGWEALDQWGDDVARIAPLTGGVGVNELWSVRVNGQLAVGRLGKRSDADLSWETDLLRPLDREAMTVPMPIPTTDGRHDGTGDGDRPAWLVDRGAVATTACTVGRLRCRQAGSHTGRTHHRAAGWHPH